MKTEKEKDFSWGFGLRPNHFLEWQSQEHVPALEIIADNLLHHKGGPGLWHTKQILARADLVLMHGVGLNIGGKDPLCKKYLEGLRDLCFQFKPSVVSDHLCFTQSSGIQSYELLPIIRTAQSLEAVANRVDAVQQFLGCQLTLENVSAYINYVDDCIPEGEFLNQICEKTGCGILLDINNVYVSAMNFRSDPIDELNRYNIEFVTQLHIAGHSKRDDFLFDTHDTPVSNEVWELLTIFAKKCKTNSAKKIPIILENDNSKSKVHELVSELKNGQVRISAMS